MFFLLDDSKKLIFAGDLNHFFDSDIGASSGSPTLKKKSISKVLQLTGKYISVNMWGIRNPTSNQFNFRQNHRAGFIQRGLDYIFVSNSLQESIQKTDILPSFCSNHLPVLFICKSRSLFEKTFGNLIVLLHMMKHT